MSKPQNVIAWLVPTARGSCADRATKMPENTHCTISTSSSEALSAHLPDLKTSRPHKAVQLTFDQSPKRPGCFVLGTDPRRCDVVLPKLPGISPQHCSLGFDAEARLVLDDFSERGTQVWYDWESAGDKTDYSWILSPGRLGGFPAAVRRITIDIQGVRFHLVVNNYAANWDAHRARVDSFCAEPWVDDLTCSWDPTSLAPIMPLFSAAPLFQHIYVKSLGEKSVGEFYLWNLARPWEPMVKATA